MQQKLFNIKPIRISRPTIDLIDLTSVYVKMAEKINKWDNQNMSHSELEEFVNNLKENFSCYDLFNFDGYELTRSLETEMDFDADRDLVDVMDSVGYEAQVCLGEYIEQWVVNCKITPKYKIGNEVKVKFKNVEYIGEVVDINTNKASYVIFIEDLNCDLVKTFEDIEDDFFSDKHWK
jgi:hypothetical protein